MAIKKVYEEDAKPFYKKPLLLASIFIILILLFFYLFGNTDRNPPESETSNTSDQTDTHGDGVVSSEEKYANVGLLEQAIKKYDRIDNFKADWLNATVTESPKDRVSKESGDTYKNIYMVDIDYTWQDKIYNVSATISWDTPQADGKAKVLSYSNSTGTYNRIDTDYTE